MEFSNKSVGGQDVQELVSQKATLHVEKNNYRPRMPPILKGLFATLEGEPTQCQTDAIICKTLFPNTFGQPSITFVPHSGDKAIPSTAGRKFKVGVVFSGGPAAGGHNVLTGLLDFMKRRNQESELIGFLGGPAGIVDKKCTTVTEEAISHYRNLGGFHFLGTGRTKIETDDQLQASLRNCAELELDGLVIIGGDDSNTNAAVLAEYFKAHNSTTCVVGVPKTIDGDLRNEDIEASFGFDTATKVYSYQVSNLCFDAISAMKTYHFVRVMGRDASHITLEVALQTHPNLAFISEEVASGSVSLLGVVEQIATLVVDRASCKKHYGVVLIPEGLVGFLPDMKLLIAELNELMASADEGAQMDPSAFDSAVLTANARKLYDSLPEFILRQMMAERDPHGNVQVAVIETERLLAHMVRTRLDELKRSGEYTGKFGCMSHYFGYEGRCSYPSKFDSDYCYTLGNTAAALLECRRTGMVATVKNLVAEPHEWVVGGTPVTSMMNIERRKGKDKPVVKKKLVDLEDAPFQTLKRLRRSWMLNDDYRVPGPIQHEGSCRDQRNFTLMLEAAARKGPATGTQK